MFLLLNIIILLNYFNSQMLLSYFYKNFPYQHYTNAIELYFSLLKSKLRKLEGLKYNELRLNIKKAIKEIPKENYKNIIKGTYERQENYIKKSSKNLKIIKHNF